MPLIYVCSECGGQSDEPHGCACGGQTVPSYPDPWAGVSWREMAEEDAAWDRIEAQIDDDDDHFAETGNMIPADYPRHEPLPSLYDMPY